MEIKQLQGNDSWVKFMEQVQAAKKRTASVHRGALQGVGNAGIETGKPDDRLEKNRIPDKSADILERYTIKEIPAKRKILGTRFDAYA